MTGGAPLLFDLDGVLIDSRVPFARSVNAALVAHDLPPRPESELHAFIGPPIHDTFATLLGGRRRVASCVAAYRARYRERAAHETPVFAGIPEVLEQLAAVAPLAIATSKPRAHAEPLLAALGLRDRFVAVEGPDLDATSESKSATVARALERVPDAVAMVGDRRFDMLAAREHGLRAVGVLWGIGDAQELRDAGADVLARTPAELPDLLLG